MIMIPYSLKLSRIKYFAVWLNSVQKQIFAEKISVVERITTTGLQLELLTFVNFDRLEALLGWNNSLINARRACARGLQYLLCVCVCVFVCSKFAAFKWSLYNKVDLPACFSPVFLDFQLTDLSKMPSFLRKSAFHGYFVVYNP